ncbi:MAG: lysophospholipid acyltransferase family protein [Fidelibacterota bacterium]
MANPENERRIKNRFLVWLGETFGPLFLKFLYKPNRWIVTGAQHYEQALTEGKSVIITSWHGTLLTVFMNLADKGFYGIAGNHYPDAEIISRIGNKLGWNILRGSSTDGGRQAYEGMIQVLQARPSVVAITPDGPQGPPKIPKAGAIKAAQKTGAVIIPASGFSTRYWSFENWDTFYVAKPFGKIEIEYGHPIAFSRDDSFDDCVQQLTKAMNQLEQEVQSRVGLAAPH